VYALEKIWQALLYNPQEPLLFNSGLFLALFTVLIAIYAFIYNHQRARILFVTIFSFYFYYKSSGVYVLLLVFCTIFNYYWAIYIHETENHQRRKLLMILSTVLNVSFLIYFKYTNFLLANLYYLVSANFQKLDIFLPIGISFYTFQTISYVIDVYWRKIEPCRNVWDFAFYLSYFPQLVAGPIVRASDFLPQIHQTIVLRRQQIGEGIFLIIKGLIKKAIIADYISQYVDLVYKNPNNYSGFENLMAMYGYALQIYCDFSGYSDMAIGIALLMGFRLMENFRSPYNSLDITEFWRRWHISLSSWLRDYIYIPMGGNRQGEEKQWLFLFLTMLIGGLWHGADWKFVFWGAMHGVALFVHKIFSQTARDLQWNQNFLTPIGWLITFHYVCFLWIFFRAQSFDLAWQSINQIVFHLDWAYFMPFIETRGLLFLIMIIGYFIHFVAESDKRQAQQYFGTLPVYAKALILVLVIQLILQLQSAEVQPFIYFQF
jgi:alginate O-acetyltransferase complex protein AlgI